MARKSVSPQRKTASKPAAASARLKKLIARTATIADKVTELLGEMRRLEKQGFVIRTLPSGKSKNPNP